MSKKVGINEKTEEFLRRALAELGIENTGMLSTDKIPFDPKLIEMCEQNRCGNYGKCWTCPPLVGETKARIEIIKSYPNALVFQKIYALEDSFDYEGMQAAGRDFRGITNKMADITALYPHRTLILAAGGCKRCAPCAAAENKPCPTPNRAVSSLEANAIMVSSLATACGLKYISGPNTLTYFAAIMF